MAGDTREITTVFKADISNFSASTQDLNRYIGQINSEFKNATASMGRWNDNTDGLSAKLTQLGGVLTAETKKLNSMEQAYAQLVAQGKQNTAEAQNLATAINNQSAKVKETQSNIDHYTKSLNELQQAGVKTKDELDKVNKELEEQKQAAKDLGGGILQGATLGIAGIAATCIGAVAGISALVDNTKELRTQMGQLETSFNEAGLSTEAATKTFDELYGVLGDSGPATEASLHLSQLAKDEEQLESLTNSLTGVYAQFGGSLPLESLAEGAQITASLGEVNGTMADALEFAGHSVDDFNKELEACNTEEERAQLVTDKLNEIYGESAEKYKEVNKDVIAANKAQNEYNQTMADIGEKAQPIVTQFKLAMVEGLQTIFKKFEEVDISGLVTKITDTIKKLVDIGLPPLMTAITFIVDNLDWLLPVLGTVAGLIAGISAAMKIYNTVMGIAKVVQLAFNLALTANPIGIVIVAIGALVAAFVLLWKKCDGFREFFINMGGQITKAFSAVVDFFKNNWKTILTFMVNPFAGAFKLLYEKNEGFRKSIDGILSKIKNAFQSAGDFIRNVFSTISGVVKGVFNTVISGINGAIKAINKISVKVPDWVPEFGGRKFGFSIPTIPKLAQGGIVDQPTLAMVGEAGKEAVMPLENNTGWIDQLANKLSGKMGNSNTTYTINNNFEKMESTRLALHKANLETKRILGGN